jgi:hypothetical protein
VRSLALVKSGLLFMPTSPDSEHGKPSLRRRIRTSRRVEHPYGRKVAFSDSCAGEVLGL